MSYLLDTAPLAAYIFGRPGAVARLDALIQNGQATTSILTFGEVIEYLRSFPNFGHNEQTLRGLLRNAVRRQRLRGVPAMAGAANRVSEVNRESPAF